MLLMNREPGYSNLIFQPTVKKFISGASRRLPENEKCVGAIFDIIVPQIVFAATVRAFTMTQDRASHQSENCFFNQ